MKNILRVAFIALLVTFSAFIGYKSYQTPIDQMNTRFEKLENRIDSLTILNSNLRHSVDSLNTIHPKPKYRREGWICPQTFYGFVLWGRVNTNGISEDLVEALENFNGPKVKITSLRRNWNSKSQHNHGRAVDLEFDNALILWLVSEQGQSWLNDHGLNFYIEDKPHSRKLLPYKEDANTSPFVFENPRATGAHIHLNLV